MSTYQFGLRDLTIANAHVDRSQKVLEVEKALAHTFVRIGNQILRDQKYPNLNLLRIKYDRLIYDNTRSALSIIQQIASRYVNDKTKTNPYPTETDIRIIKEQTEKTVQGFWRKMEINVQKEGQNVPLASYLLMTATLAATSSLAKFTQLKINDLQQQQQNPSLVGGSFGDIYSSEEDYSPSLGEPVDSLSAANRKPKFVWRTSADEKVCRICEGLNNQSWFTDDPDLPIPGEQGPGNSHFQCRCVLNLVLSEDAMYDHL